MSCSIADAGIFDVKGLHPVLQGDRELAGRTAKLFQEERAEARIGFANFDRLY